MALLAARWRRHGTTTFNAMSTSRSKDRCIVDECFATIGVTKPDASLAAPE